MKTLRFGDRSNAVADLQRTLSDFGFYTGAAGRRFDEATRASVVAFQASHRDEQDRRLERDGIVGRKTRWALQHHPESGDIEANLFVKRGDTGSAVEDVQRVLVAQGFLEKDPDGAFDKDTQDAVVYFQQAHLGEDGDFLEADGVVGPDTTWALAHPTGAPQISKLPDQIPKRLTPGRVKQLLIAVGEHGVKEVPNGSNWGPDVEKYGGKKGLPWCCYFWSWANRQAFGKYSLGRKLGLCRGAWRRAGRRQMAFAKGEYIPIPGDAFVMLYRNGSGNPTGRGHIGFVLRTAVEGGVATAINTVEGNSGNRVKIGRRKLSNADIVGFINPYDDDEQPTNWERGVFKAKRTGKLSTR